MPNHEITIQLRAKVPMTAEDADENLDSIISTIRDRSIFDVVFTAHGTNETSVPMTTDCAACLDENSFAEAAHDAEEAEKAYQDMLDREHDASVAQYSDPDEAYHRHMDEQFQARELADTELSDPESGPTHGIERG